MGIIDFRMRPLYGGYQAMEKTEPLTGSFPA